MSMNTFGHLFRVTTWGESHGPALGATVDGCPPGVPLDEAMLQVWLDKRRPVRTRTPPNAKSRIRSASSLACSTVRPQAQPSS